MVNLSVVQSVLPERLASFVGRIARACGLSRLLRPWPSHNIRNPSPCLIGWVLPKGSLPPRHRSLSLSRRRITECCVKSWPFALREGDCLLRRMNKKGSLAGVAPARPQLRTTLRPKISAPPSLATFLPSVGRVRSKRRLLSSRCPSRHPRSARPFVPRPGLRHHVPTSSTS